MKKIVISKNYFYHRNSFVNENHNPNKKKQSEFLSFRKIKSDKNLKNSNFIEKEKLFQNEKLENWFEKMKLKKILNKYNGNSLNWFLNEFSREKRKKEKFSNLSVFKLSRILNSKNIKENFFEDKIEKKLKKKNKKKKFKYLNNILIDHKTNEKKFLKLKNSIKNIHTRKKKTILLEDKKNFLTKNYKLKKRLDILYHCNNLEKKYKNYSSTRNLKNYNKNWTFIDKLSRINNVDILKSFDVKKKYKKNEMKNF